MKLYRDLFLLFAYCSVIFYLSHQSSLPIEMIFLHQDKLVHAAAYAFMAMLAWRSFGHVVSVSDYHRFGMALLFCSLYGISDEYHQSFVLGRDASVADWLADTLGATLILLYLVKNKRS